LRDLLVEEAELGERIMRALILRRVRLLRSGAGGPVIVGGADNTDVLRLEVFLERNGHPHQRLDPNSDPCARALIERFQVTSRELPLVLCPNGARLRNPTEVGERAVPGWWGRSIRIGSMMWQSSAPAPRAWQRRSMPRPRGCRRLSW